MKEDLLETLDLKKKELMLICVENIRLNLEKGLPVRDYIMTLRAMELDVIIK